MSQISQNIRGATILGFIPFLKLKYCYMLGFLGNMTCYITMGLLRFLSNATVPVA
jgi:hypothetical protein